MDESLNRETLSQAWQQRKKKFCKTQSSHAGERGHIKNNEDACFILTWGNQRKALKCISATSGDDGRPSRWSSVSEQRLAQAYRCFSAATLWSPLTPPRARTAWEQTIEHPNSCALQKYSLPLFEDGSRDFI